MSSQVQEDDKRIEFEMIMLKNPRKFSADFSFTTLEINSHGNLAGDHWIILKPYEIPENKSVSIFPVF